DAAHKGGIRVRLYQCARRGGGDEMERKFRCPVGVEQAVSLLIGVGELCVAETAEDGDRMDGGEEFSIALGELFGRVDVGVAPYADRLRACDATEFRQHDR